LENKEIFPDFPKHGPLSQYRNATSFDWKQMKLLLNDEEKLLFQNKVWSFMNKHELFVHPTTVLSTDEQRHLATKRMFVMFEQKFYTINDVRLCVSYQELFLLHMQSSQR
jgi:acyl-CoA oxidase